MKSLSLLAGGTVGPDKFSSLCLFDKNNNILKSPFRNTFRVSNSLDPDHAQCGLPSVDSDAPVQPPFKLETLRLNEVLSVA